MAPLPLAGSEGGVSRSTAPRRRSRPAMQRGPWKGGERGASMPSQMSAEQTDRFGDVLSQGFDEFVCNDGPLPQPLPREGGGVITDVNASPLNKRPRPTLSIAP